MRKFLVILVIFLYAALMCGFIFFTFHREAAMELFDINNARRIFIADRIKFSTIVLSFLTAITFFHRTFSKYDGALLTLAMALTVVTDVFLVILARQPGSHVRGLLMYCAVMCVYFCRYNHKRLKNLRILPFFLILPAAFFALSHNEGFFLHGDRQRDLFLVAVLYTQIFLAVIVSLIKSIRRGRFQKPAAVMLLLSLAFFITSDIIVVLSNWDVFGLTAMRRYIFLFYTPSQALLALSSYNFSQRRRTIAG